MTPKTEIHNIKLGNFYIENNLCKIVVVLNFHTFIRSAKFLLTIDSYNIDECMESS